jgi:hypothetical protein
MRYLKWTSECSMINRYVLLIVFKPYFSHYLFGIYITLGSKWFIYILFVCVFKGISQLQMCMYIIFRKGNLVHHEYLFHGHAPMWFLVLPMSAPPKDHAKTNNAMTHVLGLSATIRRNERLKWVVMAYSRHWQYVRANFGFTNS